MLNWRLLAERRIQEAMERGEFDNLPGAGKPLPRRDDSLVPPEWRLAFYLLERAGLAPEWVMRDAEIRADLAALDEQRRREARWVESRRLALAAMSPEERLDERARLRQVCTRTWERVREQVEQINRKIVDLNLVVPIVWLQRPLLDLETERTAWQAIWKQLDEEV